MSSEWQEANSSTDDMWDEKEQIEGKYVQIKANVGQHNSNIYILEVGKKRIGVWGSTVIDSNMERVPIDSEVRIEFIGKKPSQNGQPYKDYKIQFKPTDFQQVFGDDVKESK